MSQTNPDQSARSLTAALAAAQIEMTNASFDKVNPHFKSKYASLASIRDAAVPILAKHGVALVQRTAITQSGTIVVTELHGFGDIISSEMPVIVGEKTTPQNFGSALTYARRYSMAAIVGISADDDDDANAAMEAGKVAAPRKQKPEHFEAPPHFIPFLTGKDGLNDYDRWKQDMIQNLHDCKTEAEMNDLYRDNRGQFSTLQAHAPKIHNDVGDAFEAHRSVVRGGKNAAA